MKLYEIDQQIMDCIDTETGEVLDFDRLNTLNMEREKKLEGVALAYKNYMAEAAALKAEKDAFAEREARARSRAESIKGFLTTALGGEKFKTTTVDVSFRRSCAVSVNCDPASLPTDLQKVKPPEADKTAIRDALKAGREVPGCFMEERLNISIK